MFLTDNPSKHKRGHTDHGVLPEQPKVAIVVVPASTSSLSQGRFSARTSHRARGAFQLFQPNLQIRAFVSWIFWPLTVLVSCIQAQAPPRPDSSRRQSGSGFGDLYFRNGYGCTLGCQILIRSRCRHLLWRRRSQSEGKLLLSFGTIG